MISFVVPVFNEEATLPELFRRLEHLGAEIGEHEIILVDDGSRDRTHSLIQEEIRRRGDKNTIRSLSFVRNFGQQIALSAGLDCAQGEAVVLLDADLQDPPEVVPEFIKQWRAGAMIVYGVRRKRKEGWLKRSAYAIFYRLLSVLADFEIPRNVGDFCLMDRRVVQVLRDMPERSRFLRGLRAWTGFPSVSVEYERARRFAGESKYTLRKMVRLAMDGIVGFSTVPLKLATWIGFAVASSSVLFGCTLLAARILLGTDLRGWYSLMVSLFFIGGVQLFSIGILGEYISRIYRQTQARPLYILKRTDGT